MPDAPLVLPLDAHNQRLVDNVHPAAWENPSPAVSYHLIVVGAGAAGLAAALAAARLGAKVALIERHLLGGEVLNTGSIPSKAMLRAARAFRDARRATDYGLRGGASGDFTAAMEHVRELRADLSAQHSAWRLRDLGVDLFLGHATFAGPDTIAVAETRLHFRRALLATGARPTMPELPGLAEYGCLTSETVFSLTDLPRRMAVLGGGPLGCELAQAFARFGSQVTLITRRTQLLAREEPECAAVVQRALEADGVRVLLDCQPLGIQRPQRSRVVQFELEGHPHQLPVDEILVAAGRTPNVQGLGLDRAGVAFSPRGVEVDDRLRTANPRIFACGDLVSAERSAHLAEAQAHLVVQNALLDGKERAGDLVAPRCTFTSPEIAQVGLTVDELTAKRIRYETLELRLEENDRARLDGAAEGLLRLHYRRGQDRILGATLVGDHAGETIGELVIALHRGIGLAELARTIHPYPTQADIVRRAGEAWQATRLTRWRRKLLAYRFRRQAKKEAKRLLQAQAAAAPPPVAPPSSGDLS